MSSAVLVTGATGFIGRHVCTALRNSGLRVRGTVRDRSSEHAGIVLDQDVLVRDIADVTNWHEMFSGVDTVVHLAARVHVLKDGSNNALAAYRRVNVDATEELARRAAMAGITRLVYMSSIKVNGEITTLDANGRRQRFSEADLPAPTDPYGLSKWEAEQALEKVSRETGLQVVILRPPLVYGAGVGANFLRLVQWVAEGRPLPFGSVNNLRSLVYAGNLADAVVCCLQSPMVGSRTYLVSDTDISTPGLISAIAQSLDVKPSCFKFPVVLMRAAAVVSGQTGVVSRLLDSLLIDSSRIRRELDWTPPYGMNEGLAQTAAWYRRCQ